MNVSKAGPEFRRFLRDQRGATAVEYGMLLVIFSMVVTGGLSLLGNDLTAMFEKLNSYLTQ
jgi:pilus assembly protein Flp/PilA